MAEKKDIKGHCMICHQDNVVMSDEHVIPEAIGGYLHSYKVCKTCNSNLGTQVDKHLLNHFLIVAARQEHQLKGYSHVIPHPLTGDGVLSTGEKVRMEESGGVLYPHILPSQPEISPDNRRVKITVDKNDEKLIPKIQNRVFKKMGIDGSGFRIESHREVHEIEHPTVNMQLMFDLKNYKIGLLKIAYEFCVDQIPAYENDPKGIQFSEILHNGSVDRIDEALIDGRFFYDPYEPLLSTLIDYSKKKRHYLVLANINGRLSCMVRLFDKFCQMVQLSDKAYGEDNNILYVTINDFETHQCEVFTMEQLVEKVNQYEGTFYRFVPEDEARMQTLCDQYGDKAGFRANVEGFNIVYDQAGEPLITDAALLPYIPEPYVEEKPLYDGKLHTIYHIPPGHYFKVTPEDILIQLSEIISVSEIRKY